MGGAEAAESCSRASGETSGQASNSALPAAKLMAKARQVAAPHFLQLVFGKSLKI
jgi:hypothetical protein